MKHHWVKKCDECDKVISQKNKSGLCNYHYRLKWKRDNWKRYNINRSNSSKKYYIKNREKIIQKYKDYYWKNRETILKKQREKYWEKKKCRQTKERGEQAKTSTRGIKNFLIA